MAAAVPPTVPLLLLACVGAFAQLPPSGPLPNVGPPLLLRLEGVIKDTPAAARAKGFAVTSLGFLGSDARRWLGVTSARTVGGDNALDGKDVLALVAPFTPNLLVAGPEQLVKELRDAPPGSAVVVEGLVDRGSRTYYLRNTATALDAARGAGRESARSSAAACTVAGPQEGLRIDRSPSAGCSRWCA